MQLVLALLLKGVINTLSATFAVQEWWSGHHQQLKPVAVRIHRRR